MSNPKEDANLIVGLDIGTAKIVFVVAELRGGEMSILGRGLYIAPAIRKGVVKGVITNIDATAQGIQRALGEVELMAHCKVSGAYTAISGEHVKSWNSSGMIQIKGGEVTQSDIDRVVETARAVTLPPDKRILVELIQEFIIDRQEAIHAGQVVQDEPLGMSAQKLEVKVHLVSGAVTAINDLGSCFRRCKIEMGGDIQLDVLMSALAVLTEDEKHLGVCLLDIGAGTTAIVVFKDGQVKFTKILPIAGDQMTKDLTHFCRTSVDSAEDIKTKYGYALSRLASVHNPVEVTSVDGQEIREYSERDLANILEPRVRELFELVRKELRDNSMEHLAVAGVVISGGSAKLRGIKEAGELVFGMPVRIGRPRYSGALASWVDDPSFATSVGLVMHGTMELERDLHRAKKAGLWGWVKRKLFSSF